MRYQYMFEMFSAYVLSLLALEFELEHTQIQSHSGKKLNFIHGPGFINLL